MKCLYLVVMTALILLPFTFASESADLRRVSQLIEKMKKEKKESASSGTLSNGKIVNPAMLPVKGCGYFLAHPDRGANFGSDRLVYGLMTLAVELKDKLGEAEEHQLRIHDLSSKEGGKLPRHVNHQMGLDVDIAFYARDLKGNIIKSNWRSYNKLLKTKDGKQVFDAARNWEVVEGIMTNNHFGEIRALLVAGHLKDKLLEAAAKKLQEIKDENDKLKMKKIIEKSARLMREPATSPHDNHFHLSLALSNK